MTENTDTTGAGAPSEADQAQAAAARKAAIREQLKALGAELPHHASGLDKHEAALQAALAAKQGGEAQGEQPKESAPEPAASAEEQPQAETDAEPEVEVEIAAEVEADAAPTVVEPVPAEISGQIGHETRESAVARVEIFFAEARYFLRNLNYEFDGETGEVLAFLRSKLLPSG